MKKLTFLSSTLLAIFLIFCSCNHVEQSKTVTENETSTSEVPEYFNLRPKLEKEYGYTHAVRIGDDLKISGAVSMNDSGMIVAPADIAQQMKNCYSDLEKILQHYGYTYDDVVVENVYTTNMADFIKVSGYRNSIYKNNSLPAPGWK